jgi:hypothetical protein
LQSQCSLKERVTHTVLYNLLENEYLTFRGACVGRGMFCLISVD